MYAFLEAGQEVSFPGLTEIRLIVEEVCESRGMVRCKYYDEHLQKFIRLTLPIDAVVPSRKPAAKAPAGQGR